MDEEYTELKIICPKCRYEYTLRVLRMPKAERCPNCGHFALLDEFEITEVENK